MQLQDLQAFPWERQQAFEDLCLTLEAMEAELSEPTSAESREQLWPALHAMSDRAVEVRDACNQNVPVFLMVSSPITLAVFLGLPMVSQETTQRSICFELTHWLQSLVYAH